MSDSVVLDRDRIGDAQRRLLESVPDELDAAGEPDPPEQEVCDNLKSEGWEILGSGMGRVVAVPPTEIGPDDVVVKLTRPNVGIQRDSLSGTGQNAAERQVWEAVSNGEVDGVEPDWFAPVVTTGTVELHGATYRDAWLVMERYVPITSLGRDSEWVEDAEAAVEARFLECVMRPDMSPDNIGVADPGDAPETPRPDDPLVVIDYGMPNWVTEDGLY